MCPVSFANRIKLSAAWVHGGAAPDSSVKTIPTPMHVTSDKDAPVAPPNLQSATIADPTVIPDTQDLSDQVSVDLSIGSQKVLFDDEKDLEVMESAVTRNWSDQVPPSQDQDDASTVESLGVVEPKLIGNDASVSSDGVEDMPSSLCPSELPGTVIKLGPPPSLSISQPVNSTLSVESTSGKRKIASQPTPGKKHERSRSRIRFPQEDPMDTIRMSQIILECEPWHSCPSGFAKRCSWNLPPSLNTSRSAIRR